MSPKNAHFVWCRISIVVLALFAMLLPGNLVLAKGKSYAWVAGWPSRAGARPSSKLLSQAIKTVGRQKVASWMVRTTSGRLRFPAKRELPQKIIKKAVKQVGLQAVALRHDKASSFGTNYRVMVPLAKSRKTSANQQGSGRCWIFAGTLAVESMIKVKRGKDIKLSENYVNYQALRRLAFGVLDNVVESSAMEAKIRKIKKLPKHLLANLARKRLSSVQQISEGGFAGWYYPLVRQHGLIPESAYPSDMPANRTSDYIGHVRTVVANAVLAIGAASNKGERTKILKQARQNVVAELNLALGKPPKQFTIDGKRYTPRTYRKRYLKLADKDLDMVILSNDPTESFNQRHVVSGFPGMPEFATYNVSMDRITKAAKKTLRKGQALYFSSIVSSGNPHVAGQRNTDPRAALGLLSLSAFDYSFLQPKGTRELSKRTRLKAGMLRANHAMTLVGYDTTKDLRWLVQNSYGDNYGDHGRMHMHQDFFKSYGSSVAVPRSSVPKTMFLKMLAKPIAKSSRQAIVDL